MITELPANTILLVEVGSTAHGTGIAGGEDHDETAIVVEEIAEVLLGSGDGSRMERTQPEGSRSGPGDTDRTLHSLRKFLHLAISGNPSILLTLWAPVILSTSEGEELREIRQAFVGRHVIPRYRGYMQAQGMRLFGLKGNGHGRRGGGGREELISEYGYDTKYAMHCARLGFQGLELVKTGGLKLPVQGTTGEWLRDVRYGRVPFKDWFEVCLDLDNRLDKLLHDKNYPDEPNMKVIEEYTIRTHETVWEQGVSMTGLQRQAWEAYSSTT